MNKEEVKQKLKEILKYHSSDEHYLINGIVYMIIKQSNSYQPDEFVVKMLNIYFEDSSSFIKHPTYWFDTMDGARRAILIEASDAYGYELDSSG